MNYKLTVLFTIWLAVLMISNGCATNVSKSHSGNANAAKSGQWQRIPSDSKLSNSIRYFGYIDINQNEDSDFQYFEAGFAQFDRPAPLSRVLQNFRHTAVDSCTYQFRERGDTTPLAHNDEFDFPDYPYQFISAGSSISVVTKLRRYAKLKKVSSKPDDIVQYSTDIPTFPISIAGLKLGNALLKTQGLYATSDGGDFPAFTDIAIPPVNNVRGYKPGENKSVTADTQFRWRKSNNLNDPDLRVQIEAMGNRRAVICTVADDGTFEYPANIKSELGGASMHSSEAYRDTVWFYIKDDAVLIVSQSSFN